MTRPLTQPSIDRSLEIRTCPACHHEHAVGTTCRECETCSAPDLVAIAQEVFADLLPGSAGASAAVDGHNDDLRITAPCNGACGTPGCRCLDANGCGVGRERHDDGRDVADEINQ